MGLIKLSITDEDKAVITFLLKEMQREYIISKPERGRIHEIEWDAGDGTPSVLGEAEVLADFICGIALSLLENRFNEEYRDGLSSLSVHQSNILHQFLREKSLTYPKFAAYILATEYLRAIIQRILGRG